MKEDALKNILENFFFEFAGCSFKSDDVRSWLAKDNGGVPPERNYFYEILWGIKYNCCVPKKNIYTLNDLKIEKFFSKEPHKFKEFKKKSEGAK